MRISATGKMGFRNPPSGYTLMEVIAVIAVLGLVTLTLTAPGYLLDGEKTRIQYAGKLIGADLAAVRLQARLDSAVIPVDFMAAGYDFQIGGTTISRRFKEDHFAFQIAAPDGAGNPVPSPPSPAAAGLSDQEVAPALDVAPGETGAGDPALSQVKAEKCALVFRQNGLERNLSLPWTTNHFQGSLDVKADGSVEWLYGRR